MIKLYGATHSRTHRILWLLRELELPFEHHPVDFLTQQNLDPAFLRINPNGRVPALVDGDVALCESLAINLYLSRRYGGETAARGMREEALSVQWGIWAAAELDKALFLVAANLRFFAEPDRRAADAALGLVQLARPFKVLDAELATKPFLFGDRFSIADLNVAAVLSLVPLCDIPTDDYPNMTGWLHRCLERPAADDYKQLKFVVPRPDPASYMAMFL